MPPVLRPLDQVEDSVEVYLNPGARLGPTVYLATLTFVLAGLIALPLVRVSVAIQADGLIRPAVERHDVVASASGYVEEVRLTGFDRVRAGDELFRLADTPLDSRRALTRGRLAELGEDVRELETLLSDGSEADLLGKSRRESRQLAEQRLLLQELTRLGIGERQATEALGRTTALARLGLVSDADEERIRAEVETFAEERRLISARYRSDWRARLTQLRIEEGQLRDQLSTLVNDSLLRVVRAPVDGTIEEMTSLSPGSYIREGQRLAVISPEAELVAEVLLSPRDFGLVDRGTPVRLLIDAFPHQDWGHLSGRVIEVPDDYQIVGERAVFRARVSLDDTELSLANGIRRAVRKGMTLRARIMVTERSLWQLLRDDINDWVNPPRPAGMAVKEEDR
jgi:HlyD family secretion protein